MAVEQRQSTNDIFLRRYDSAGAAIGGEFLVNTSTASFEFVPDVASGSDGGFTVTWESDE